MRVEARGSWERPSPLVIAIRVAVLAILEKEEFDAAGAIKLGGTLVVRKYEHFLNGMTGLKIPGVEEWTNKSREVIDAMGKGDFAPLRQFLLNEAWSLGADWTWYRGLPEEGWKPKGIVNLPHKLKLIAHALPDRGEPFTVPDTNPSQTSPNSL